MPARKLIVLLLSLLTAASLSAAGSGTPRGSKAADVLEYAPALLPWAVKAAGGETRSGWARMGVSQAAGAAFTAGLVESLKLTVHETRPDGSDDRAFPSGHAAIAFMGATMIERELGWRSPWYTLGAYTFATGIAMERVIDRRHRPVDVIAGAGIGILATHLGYIVGDAIFGSDLPERTRLRVTTDRDNIPFVSLETAMLIPMYKLHAGTACIIPELALSAGLKGGVPLTDNLSLHMQLALQSTPIYIDCGTRHTYVAPLNAIGIEIGPSYSLPLSNVIELTGELSGGYYKNFHLRTDDNSIRPGSGTGIGRVTIGAQWRLTDRMAVGAHFGYQISRSEFSVSPSAAYAIQAPASVSATASALLINISTKVSF